MQTTMTPMLVGAPSARERDLRADVAPIFAGGVALALICGFGLWFVSPSPSSPPVEPSAAPDAVAVERAPVEPRPIPTRAHPDPFGGLVLFAAAPDSPAVALALRGADPAAYGSLVGLFPNSAPAALPASPIVAKS